MEKHLYNEIKTHPIEDDENEKYSWKPFFRQILVCSGVCTGYFMAGLVFGAPTVIIPQLRQEANSTDAVSMAMASWLSSMGAFAGLPWTVILSAATGIYGRKKPFLLVNLVAFIGYVVLYTSHDLTQLLTSFGLLGMLLGSQITISLIILPEYSSPKYRSVFLPLKSASGAWGLWVSNAIGTFFHWKWIAVLGILCSIFNLITIMFWPESPIWLASKGQFQKCSKSHRWLKGNNEYSENELENLINHQKKYINYCNEQEMSGLLNQFRNFSKLISTMEFYKPILISFVSMSLYHFCGKMVCAVYSIDIIRKVTGDQRTAYIGMLLLDGITVLGMYSSCVLSKFLNRRTLLFIFSSLTIMFLCVFSFYLYLIHCLVITENTYVSLVLLTAFSLSISCGPGVIATIFAEITPMRYRNFSLLLYGVYFNSLLAVTLKVAPYMFRDLKMYGSFLFYALTTSIFTVILYIYLPETKGKTTQEIEECMLRKYVKPIKN